MPTKDSKEHWNKVYTNSPIELLGWFEEIPALSLELISLCAVSKDAHILDVGSGVSTLIGSLLDEGYENITALDISEIALQKAQERLGAKKAPKVNWLVADIAQPVSQENLPGVFLWHDRAVFHFLTDSKQREGYIANLLKLVLPGGFAIIAEFAIGGADKCSGLDIAQYDAQSLAKALGSAFELQESRSYIYQMPSGGLRPYIYALFKKVP